DHERGHHQQEEGDRDLHALNGRVQIRADVRDHHVHVRARETADELRECQRYEHLPQFSACCRHATPQSRCRRLRDSSREPFGLSKRRSRSTAAAMSARCVNACGKLPTWLPVESISSEYRPRWLAYVSIFANVSRASSIRPERASAST